MNVPEAVAGVKQHLEAFVASAKEKLEQELPVLADLADKAAVNPALAAILSATHLTEVPVFLETIAKLVTDADNAIATSKAAGAAEATAAAAAAAAPSEPETPADPTQ